MAGGFHRAFIADFSLGKTETGPGSQIGQVQNYAPLDYCFSKTWPFRMQGYHFPIKLCLNTLDYKNAQA